MEENGTLYDYYRFTRVRFSGTSSFGLGSTSYNFKYDVILWDTGDISVHVITITNKSNARLNCTISNSDNGYAEYYISPSVLDLTINYTSDNGFTILPELVSFEIPGERRYLIRSESKYYTVIDDNMTEISIQNNNITSSVFLTHGMTQVPSLSLFTNLNNPELLYWSEKEKFAASNGAAVIGTPQMPQSVYYDPIEIPSGKILELVRTKNTMSVKVKFSISFDGGETWKYYDYMNKCWYDSINDNDGMSYDMLPTIPSSKWMEFNSSTIQLRAKLFDTSDDTSSKIFYKLSDIESSEE
jgi:hypothetical protein